MRRAPTAAPVRRALAVLATLAAALASVQCGTARRADPLAAEIARWSAFVEGDTASEAIRVQVRDAARPVVASAREALDRGWRLLALMRVGVARENLSALLHADDPATPPRGDSLGFESEWARVGAALREDLAPARSDAFAGLRPAAIRALAEAAHPQVRVYYAASRDFGRNTAPDNGRFYLGAAQAQREFVDLCRSLAVPARGRAPALRPLGADLDSLEADLLALYRPPLSIERHPEFIAASALVKEARELDAAGLRHGALVRYLEAARRTALLGPAGAAPAADSLARRVDALEARLARDGADHSVARLFLEVARANLADATSAETRRAGADAVVAGVLPRYFAALAPAPPAPPRPPARVTVTLVRWPYT
jgi:hypothetical protein